MLVVIIIIIIKSVIERVCGLITQVIKLHEMNHNCYKVKKTVSYNYE